MANPSPEAISAIRAEVSDWTSDDASIAASLDAPTTANPALQAQVPRVLVAAEMISLLAPASLAKVYSRPAIVAFEQSIRGQDRASASNWIALAFVAGDVTQPERDALLAYVAGTVPDPTYRPSISWAESTLGRLVDSEDVAAARPQGA